ncbi:MAG TPA: Pycsar system effector family protein [Streptomyces sp.]|uniref:Pycsar system effector family protein n=1 Tax=Streptomyces sp. TaxID=1931 RepID=UPI002D22B1BF|nr:Pycsar system effector family protein [Streptomyces sp.]HZG02176.1 Pycsar system effector family protein [Streptomyces sp.]
MAGTPDTAPDTAADTRAIDSALAEVRAELVRADQKAATLLALFSAMAAGILTLFVVRRGGLFSLWNGVEWLAWAGTAALAGSLAQLLFCVRPQGSGRPTGRSYFAFYALHADHPDRLIAHLRSVSAANGERCVHLVALSVLARRKYRMIARAVDLLGCSLLLIAGAMLVSALR